MDSESQGGLHLLKPEMEWENIESHLRPDELIVFAGV